MKFINRLLHNEIISYLIFGVLTTVINIVVFDLLCFNMPYLIANVIAWFVSVLFAFVTNKAVVFRSHTNKLKDYLMEALKFFASRIVTLVLESVMLFIFIQCLQWNEMLVKLIAQVLVIVLNYILSKLIVFVKKPKKQN